MKAIILAGGFGTRLRSITGEHIPKCMVKGCYKFGTRDLPWMEIIIRNLYNQGIQDITLALHYKAKVFTDWFKGQSKYANIKYKIEDEPLGTGGAIKNCIDGTDPILVLNGDTCGPCDFNDMLANHIAPLTVAVTQKDGYTKNAGVYIINPELFDHSPAGAFSFESFIINKLKKFYIVSSFTDMGTPEGYAEVQE